MKLGRHSPVFHVFLVRPSKYDDDGFVIRHWRAVVPSNSLACLNGLTEDARQRHLLGDVDLRVSIVDEAVTKVPLARIDRLNRRAGERVLVCLVGVQTNQFCRAADLALTLRKRRVDVIIGGFHISGMLAIFDTVSPEIQELLNAGVSVVAGEVEDRWGDLLRDAWERKLKPVYRFLDAPPDLSGTPRPIIDKKSRRKYIHSNYGTLDCSRGCPFNCSFCTIINVQGRRTRCRSPQSITDAIRLAYRESGANLYFFTDDNFARNPAWAEIFDRLVALREQEGIRIEFVIQVDVLAYRIPGFIEKARRAGCCTAFIGIESLNPRNLEAAGKTHNRVEEYKDSIAAWRNARVTTLVGYIIGFPYDTEESVRSDIDRLIRDVAPDQASFFMLMPLPGSRDHERLLKEGIPLNPDYNQFDSVHESIPHPHMKGGAWTRTYQEAWQRFYSLENLKAILSRAHPENYWDLFSNLVWYKNSILNEDTHPMLAGFVRLKDRASRRACFAQETRYQHLRRRLSDWSRLLRGTCRLVLEMEELWLATCPRSEAESRRANCLRETRTDLATFWTDLRRQAGHGRIEKLLRLDRIALNALWEVRLASGFFLAVMTAATGVAGDDCAVSVGDNKASGT